MLLQAALSGLLFSVLMPWWTKRFRSTNENGDE
jgi:hypothetical protein